jgi:predicted nucleotide-binding protein
MLTHPDDDEQRILLADFGIAARYAVIIATANDLGRDKDDKQENPRARQNVVFEMGYIFGLRGGDPRCISVRTRRREPSDTDAIV